MIMTREEAGLLWCPFARVGHNNTNHSANRSGTMNGKTVSLGIVAGSQCIADDCMAWRWITREDANTAEQIRTNKGYCGLAGRPMA